MDLPPKYHNRIKSIEEKVPLLCRQLKMVTVILEGIKAKPKKKKEDDPHYGEFKEALN